MKLNRCRHGQWVTFGLSSRILLEVLLLLLLLKAVSRQCWDQNPGPSSFPPHVFFHPQSLFFISVLVCSSLFLTRAFGCTVFTETCLLGPDQQVCGVLPWASTGWGEYVAA